jgi:hypothetical protein
LAAGDIDRSPTGDLAYMGSERGFPISIKGMANRVKDWCIEAGLPHCSTRGIRKLASVVAAENGITGAQMKALFNWSSVRRADAYIEHANKKKLANQAISLLVGAQDGNEIVPRLSAND